MKIKMIVWHLSHELAVARGLASETEHTYPYTDAHCGFGERGKQAAKELWDARCYEPVAVVESEAVTVSGALEHAFAFTNHVDSAWNRKGCRKEVKPLHNERNRSTSVGDVVEVLGAGQSSVKHLVATMGFTQL